MQWKGRSHLPFRISIEIGKGYLLLMMSGYDCCLGRDFLYGPGIDSRVNPGSIQKILGKKINPPPDSFRQMIIADCAVVLQIQSIISLGRVLRELSCRTLLVYRSRYTQLLYLIVELMIPLGRIVK